MVLSNDVLHQLSLPNLVIVRELGRGGTAVVHEIRSARGRDALKVYETGSDCRTPIEHRVKQELELGLRVQAERVVQIKDAGLVVLGGRARPSVLMELVSGEPLDHILSRGSLPEIQAMRLAQDVANGLRSIHVRGFVHRDLKPSNIMVERSGRAKIIDLGVAVSPSASLRLTCAGGLVGSPLYLPPECFWDADQDAAPSQDLYALGACMFEMVCGELPFGQCSLGAFLEAARSRTPLSPRNHRAHVSERYSRITEGLTASEPGDRAAALDLLLGASVW